jgi:medium-chain acyl-[acyl-carrier-protein] hydrolase
LLFFGHSLGALIAFELAGCLRQSYNCSPAYLFVSGNRAPHLLGREAPLHLLPDRHFIDELKHRFNGIPQVILDDPELLQLFLPTLRADLTLLETYVYQPGPPLDCPISAYGGLQDHWADPPTIEAWRPYTQSAFNSRMFPGGHFYLQTERTALLQNIVKELAHVSPCLETLPR